MMRMLLCLPSGQYAAFSVCLQVIRQFGLRSQPGGVQPVASSTSPHLLPSLTNEAFVSSITNVSQCRIHVHFLPTAFVFWESLSPVIQRFFATSVCWSVMVAPV